MKPFPKISILIGVLALAFFTGACGLTELKPSTPASITVEVVDDPNPTPTALVAENTPTPVETATAAQLEPTRQPAYSGFVTYLTDAKEFQMIDLNGNIQARIPAPGFDAFSHNQVDVVNGNIYYYSSIDNQIYRANAHSLEALTSQPAQKPYGFKISADEQQIVWSIAKFDSTPISSELWIGNLDGSNAYQIATANVEQSPAFLFLPLEWTPDGRVLYNLSPTGFGGYILYGGSNSLYGYDPATHQTVTYVPAEELHGLCLDSYRLDLNKVTFNCGASGSEVIIRNLTNGSEQHMPPYPGYLLAGSIRFSPNGEWLAYASAKGDPEAEESMVLVQPADLSGDLNPIASMNAGFFYVETWLDDNSLLVTRNDHLLSASIIKMNRDGSNQQTLASGWFVDLLP